MGVVYVTMVNVIMSIKLSLRTPYDWSLYIVAVAHSSQLSLSCGVKGAPSVPAGALAFYSNLD